MSEKECRTCRWLNVKPSKSGRRIVRKANGYACNVPLPEVVLPLCITDAFGFRPLENQRGYVIPTWTGCPLHEEIK